MVGGIENEGESTARTRKNHPPSLKAKVAIETIKAQKTTTQSQPERCDSMVPVVTTNIQAKVLVVACCYHEGLPEQAVPIAHWVLTSTL